MTTKVQLRLALLCLFLSSCSSNVGFEVKVVDAVSGSPIQSVKVVRSTLHYHGIKKVARNDETLGRTDALGSLSVEALNLVSRDNTIKFSKIGYEPTDLLVGEISGAPYFYISRAGSVESVSEGPIRGPTKIEVPLWRE